MAAETERESVSAKSLTVALRIVGVVSCAAIIAAIMPNAWIERAHSWLGFGKFPDSAIAYYLARSISGLYAVFGGMILALSMDVKRYAPVIRFLAYATIGFGGLLVFVDGMAGMPRYWILVEGPVTIVIGVVILVLSRRVGV